MQFTTTDSMLVTARTSMPLTGWACMPHTVRTSMPLAGWASMPHTVRTSMPLGAKFDISVCPRKAYCLQSSCCSGFFDVSNVMGLIGDGTILRQHISVDNILSSLTSTWCMHVYMPDVNITRYSQ